MKNFRRIELTCENLNKFSEILPTTSFKEASLGRKLGSVAINTDKDITEKEICKLSKEYPTLIFYTEISFFDDNHNTIRCSEYQNGIEKQISIEAIYRVVSFNAEAKEELGDVYNELYEKGIEIFRRMDVVRETDAGNKYIDFVNSVVLNIEDEQFLMKLIKNKSFIDVECFYKDLKTELTEIESEEEDLPF